MTGWIFSAFGVAIAIGAVQFGRLRRQLRASREAFAVLAERAPVGILRSDAQGRCTYANGVWCEISGLSLAETLGHSWSRAVHPDDELMVITRWEESVRRREPYVNEVRLRRPDGTERRVLAGACPTHDDQGRVTGFVGTVLDVTRLDHARRELGEREQLLRTLIDVQENEKQLLCHEFHDGLIQYAVGSKMLLEGLRERPLPEVCRSAVDAVIECLGRGIEDGRRVIRGIRPAALDDLGLRAALEELADDLRGAAIAVEATFDPRIDELPPPLQTTVYRVVQESLNNARKHSGSGRVVVSAIRAGDEVELLVEDFGRGFDPARTVESGFGLVGIRERVRLVGGVSRVEAGAGRGTRISVSLPLHGNGPVTGLPDRSR